MRVEDDVEFAAATHVGRVRSANEDDYLLYAPPDPRDATTLGRVLAVADGMGGVAGGAEASRAAIRAIGAALAAPTDGDPESRLRAAFDAASARVHELAAESPALADMGTTLTVALLLGDRAFVGHVGDTRCLRVRRGVVEQITEDHAMREPRNLLTRAIGAGQRHELADVFAVDLGVGDVLVLCTDGVWNLVGPDEIGLEFRSGDLQVACERTIRRVWERGAPDNATIVAGRILSTTVGRRARELDLPRREVEVARIAGGDGEPVRGVRWPTALFVVSAILAVLAWLRIAYGFDVVSAVGRALH